MKLVTSSFGMEDLEEEFRGGDEPAEVGGDEAVQFQGMLYNLMVGI